MNILYGCNAKSLIAYENKIDKRKGWSNRKSWWLLYLNLPGSAVVMDQHSYVIKVKCYNVVLEKLNKLVISSFCVYYYNWLLNCIPKVDF